MEMHYLALAEMACSDSVMPTGRKRVAYSKMVVGLAWLGAFVVLSGKYNFGTMLQPWVATMPLWYR
jgi:lysophospholipid acyltransferase